MNKLDEVILDVLSDGQWANRSAIAEKLGRPGRKLNPYDISRLKVLCDTGLAEFKEEMIGIAQSQYVYRRVKM